MSSSQCPVKDTKWMTAPMYCNQTKQAPDAVRHQVDDKDGMQHYEHPIQAPGALRRTPSG